MSLSISLYSVLVWISLSLSHLEFIEFSGCVDMSFYQIWEVSSNNCFLTPSLFSPSETPMMTTLICVIVSHRSLGSVHFSSFFFFLLFRLVNFNSLSSCYWFFLLSAQTWSWTPLAIAKTQGSKVKGQTKVFHENSNQKRVEEIMLLSTILEIIICYVFVY